jgi:hypothetical protein
MESEFGRGYATCLLMFTWHTPRLEDGSIYLKPHLVVELWANGASDHLYELKIGGRVPRADGKVASAMATAAIDCGHGFRRKYTHEAARGWIATAMGLLANIGNPQTLEEAMEIDRGLGLRPEKGEWGCEGYLDSRAAK